MAEDRTRNSFLHRYLVSKPISEQNEATIAQLASLDYIRKYSPETAESIVQELRDQRSNLKLIASENFSSQAVQLAMGNWLTDKYAEGHPHHRFYSGCQNIDAIEQRGVDLAKELFGAEHAYIQPHSGVDANSVAYWSILVHRVQNSALEKLGKKSVDELTPEEYEIIRKEMVNQKIMGLSLNSGGHLTHGYRHNISAKMMRSVNYEVDPNTRMIDYAALAERVKAERPTIFLAGYSSYPRLVNFAIMREIADSVNAVFMVDMSHFAGLVAGKVFEGDYNPVPFAHIVTSTTHKTLRGPRGGMVLCAKEYQEVINKGCPLVLGGPMPQVMAAKTIAFEEALRPDFRTYATQIVKNSRQLAKSLMESGISISTNGSDNHLVVLELTELGITGRQGEQALRDAGLTVNRNAIPWDKNGAWYTSGIRLGTAAATTLGMKEKEMEEIGKIIADILRHTKPTKNPKTGGLSKAHYEVEEKVLKSAQARVKSLLSAYPLYPDLNVDPL